MQVADPTASAIWVFANLSYTGMRAQNTGGMFWRVVSFIFGFPGTFITLLVVDEGCQRAYGVDLPRRRESGKRNARDLYETRGKPFTYQTGDEIKGGDHISFQGEPGRVEFVALAPADSPELRWYVEQYGGGVMISNSKGHTFLTRNEVAEDLVLLSREPTPSPQQ
jgi:hypothetical protein